MPVRKTGAALLTTCAMMAIAPALAQAGNAVRYAGPVALPEREPGVTPHASIQFTVKFKKNGNIKWVDNVRERNIYETCADGKVGYPTVGNSESSFYLDLDWTIDGTRVGQKLRKRTFSARTPSDEQRVWWVTGKVPRRGPATGTIRFKTHYDAYGKRPATDCDTGVLKWTATRRR